MENIVGYLFAHFNIIDSQSGNSSLQALFFWLQKLGKDYVSPKKKMPFKQLIPIE